MNPNKKKKDKKRRLENQNQRPGVEHRLRQEEERARQNAFEEIALCIWARRRPDSGIKLAETENGEGQPR